MESCRFPKFTENCLPLPLPFTMHKPGGAPSCLGGDSSCISALFSDWCLSCPWGGSDSLPTQTKCQAQN